MLRVVLFGLALGLFYSFLIRAGTSQAALVLTMAAGFVVLVIFGLMREA